VSQVGQTCGAMMRPILLCVLVAAALAGCGHQAADGDISEYLPGGRVYERERERQAEGQREYEAWREADRLRDLCYRSSDARGCPR